MEYQKYFTQLIIWMLGWQLHQLWIPEAEIFPIPWRRCCFILFLTVSEVVHGVHRWCPALGRMSSQLSNHWLPRIMNIGSSQLVTEMELENSTQLQQSYSRAEFLLPQHWRDNIFKKMNLVWIFTETCFVVSIFLSENYNNFRYQAIASFCCCFCLEDKFS